MSKFKIGDIVVGNHNAFLHGQGMVGEVVETDSDHSDGCWVRYSDGTTNFTCDGELFLEVRPDEKIPFVGHLTSDSVNHPSHYGQGKIEAIEYIKDSLTYEEYIGYLQGNCKKYQHRWKYKDGLQDLKKAKWYLEELIKTVDDHESKEKSH